MSKEQLMTKVATVFKPVFLGRPQKYDSRELVRGEKWSRFELIG